MSVTDHFVSACTVWYRRIACKAARSLAESPPAPKSSAFLLSCGMGCFSAPLDPELLQDIRKHRKLVQILQTMSENLDETTKMLLLGAGESGKSTIFKQMRIINATGYSEAELAQFRWIIHRNVLDAIKILVEQVHARDVALLDENEDLADAVLLWPSESLNPEMAATIEMLWADPGIQQVFDLRAEYQLGDNAPVLLSDVKRIAAVDYLPTTDDALRARVRTSGVVSKDFSVKGRPFVVWDVGGQRSERRNWLPLFNHVTVIIFVVAISEYDQVVAEDRAKNRMQESLELFTQIVNSKHFKDADVMIFFNKRDLFAEKIERVDPKKWFPEYKGGCNYKAAEAYFTKLFKGCVEGDRKNIYTYTTCATDTGNMKFVLDAVSDMLVSAAMSGGY